jgi:peptidoglycan hydrolase CwlO-like protein
MFRFLALALSVLLSCDALPVLAQQPQPSAQQTVTATVTQMTQATSNAVAIINQVPAMVEQIEKLQAQITAKDTEIANLKKDLDDLRLKVRKK